MSDVTDPVLLLRQSVCSHAFIKAPNCPMRCAHCGVEKAEWERRQETITSLNQFRTAASESPNAAGEALRFLEALPGYLPAPKAAQSETGAITLFWHVDNFYADAEFRGDGKFSVFTRSRVDGNTRDDGFDDEPLENAGGCWLATFLAPMPKRL